MNDFFEKIKLCAFDLDGTVYLGNDIIPGAVELIGYLREKYKVVFFTNNSTKSRKEVHKKLSDLGVSCELEEIYTASSATILYLNESSLNDVYVIGSESFRGELERNGVRLIDNDSAENLVIGFDMDFNYQKITTALSVLLNGGRFIVCNEDGSFPVGNNRYLPGCGAMVGAISACANKRPDFIVGKPNTYILSKIAHAYEVDNNEIVVAGDSYESDIRMALNYESKAIWVHPYHRVVDENVLAIENLQQLLNYVKEH